MNMVRSLKFKLNVDVNIGQFVRVVNEDKRLTKRYIINEVDDALDTARNRARDLVLPISRTYSLHKSIRKFSYGPPIGYIFVKGFSAGGYVTNPNTGRPVDYAQIVDEGSTNPEHRQEPYPYFTIAEHELRMSLDRRFRRAISKVARRRVT